MKSKANQCEYTKAGAQRCGGTKKQGGIYCPIHSQEPYSENKCQSEVCTRYVAEPGTECYACHADATKINIQNNAVEDQPDDSDEPQQPSPSTTQEQQPTVVSCPTLPPSQSKLQTVHQKMAVEALKSAKQAGEEIERCGAVIEDLESQLLDQTKNLARVVKINRGSIARSEAKRQKYQRISDLSCDDIFDMLGEEEYAYTVEAGSVGDLVSPCLKRFSTDV